MCPIVNKARDFGISRMCKDEDAVVMEVGTSKGKKNLEVIRSPLVSVWNIRRGGGNAGHTQILRHISKE
jgi:hypothetical protein